MAQVDDLKIPVVVALALSCFLSARIERSVKVRPDRVVFQVSGLPDQEETRVIGCMMKVGSFLANLKQVRQILYAAKDEKELTKWLSLS